jgi:pantothenate kinase
MHGSTELHNRRGAHWTFNIERLIEDIRNLRWIGEGSFPSFDHHIGDPIEDAIKVCICLFIFLECRMTFLFFLNVFFSYDNKVEPAHRIVLVEGNYLLLYDVSPWDKLASLFDMKLYLSCDLDVTRTRLIKRHMSTGDTQERAIYKADSNDVKNGELVQSCSIKYADKVLASR